MITGRTSGTARASIGRRRASWSAVLFVLALVAGLFAFAPTAAACTHDIVIHKAETGVLAPGGTYEIHVTGPRFDRTVVVPAGGTATIAGVAPGLYEFEELDHPDAVIAPNPLLVPNDGSNGDVVDVFVTNDFPGGRLAITKVETGSAAPGGTHTFDITGPATLSATVTAGTTWTSDWLPLGTYTITERNAPVDHTITPNPVTLDTDEQTVTVTATNPYLAARLAIQKVQAGIAGVGAAYTFEVHGPVTFNVEVRAGTTWTSELLPLGTYTVTERNAPVGHTIVPALAVLSADGSTVTVVATNPAVLSESSPPVRLPATGAAIDDLALLAGFVVAAGGVLTVAGHRRRSS
jgi:Domain of unknown function (DUF5979)